LLLLLRPLPLLLLLLLLLLLRLLRLLLLLLLRLVLGAGWLCRCLVAAAKVPELRLSLECCYTSGST
jgi:hypothetical protein